MPPFSTSSGRWMTDARGALRSFIWYMACAVAAVAAGATTIAVAPAGPGHTAYLLIGCIAIAAGLSVLVYAGYERRHGR
jgi:hypothetical protein